MILAVTGGKGGVGKSTVAYELGATMDGVVVDADLGMADLPSGRGPDLHDVLAGRASPVEAVDEDAPVRLLPCGRTLTGARACDPTELVAAVETVAAEYGRVVVDCPAGMGGDVGLALLVAEACLLVTTPRREALSDAVRARALARELDAGLAGVALNRVRAGDEGHAGRCEDVQGTFGAPVTEIPESAAVSRAWRHGVPVVEHAPDATASGRFRTLARTVQSAISARS